MGMSVVSMGSIASSAISVEPSPQAAAAAATGVSGPSPAPGGNATGGPPGGNLDLTVLNLAVVLENLESSFYSNTLILILCAHRRAVLTPPLHRRDGASDLLG